MSAIVTDLPAVEYAPPVRCATWCASGDGHPGRRYREDQHCDSLEHKVETSLHEPWDMVDGSTQTAHLLTLARKDPDSKPFVVVVTPDDAEVKLTPQEARDLVQALQHFAWVAEQDERERNAFVIGTDYGHDRATGQS